MTALIPYPVQANTIYPWDALTLASTMRACGFRVNCVVTSPPYFGLRDYGTSEWEGGDSDCDHAMRGQAKGSKAATSAGTLRDKPFNICPKCGAVRVDQQIGLEQTPDEYVRALVTVFRAVRDVLTDDGTLWLNLGDSYCSTDKWGGGKSGNTGKQTVATDGSVPSWAIRKRRPSIPGVKPKDLLGIPWRVAFALQADGWYLRSDVVWSKPNAMPESVTDRPTKAHEYLFLLSKSSNYYYDAEAIKEPVVEDSDVEYRQQLRAGKQYDSKAPYKANTPYASGKQAELGKRTYTGFNDCWDARSEPLTLRNKRTVWTIPTQPYAGAHFAVMPQALVEPCVLAGCPIGGVVFDPFMGSGTVGLVARQLGRAYVGSELNAGYVALARERLRLPFEQHYLAPNNDLSELPLFAAQEQPA